MMSPRHPNIIVQLTGIDGNAFAILGAVTKAMRKANCHAEEIAEFKDEAMSGNYEHLLQTCMAWVTCK